jgi:transposase-like protein
VKRVDGQTVKRVAIEVGISSHSLYEVKRGLQEGNTIQWDAGGED